MTTDESSRVAQLFLQEVPEIAAGEVAIKAVARVVGVRTKLAVESLAPRIDAIKACVGPDRSRIRRIADQLGGERIDIVLWDDSVEKLICNALQPARIERIVLHPAQHRAVVTVTKDQVPLALGRGGENRDLAGELSGWDLEVVAQ